MRLSAWHAALAASVTTHAAMLGLGSVWWRAVPAAPHAGTPVAQHVRLIVVAAPGAAADAPAPLMQPPQLDPMRRVTPDLAPDRPLAVAPDTARVPPVDLSTRPTGPVAAASPRPTHPRSLAAIEVIRPEAHPEPAAPGAAPRAAPAQPVAGDNPPPPYPRVAHRNGWSGTVLLDVRITRDGGVTDVRVARSSGHRVLDRAAADAVRQWRFTPAQAGPLRYAADVRVPIVFRLEDAD